MSYRKQFEKEMNRIEGEKRKKYLEDKYKQLKNKKDTHKSKNKKLSEMCIIIIKNKIINII